MLYGRDYDAPQKCSEGRHECGEVDSCVRCEPGDWFCAKHITACEMCRRTFCPRHAAELQKTDMGMLCDECAEEFCPLQTALRKGNWASHVFGTPLPTEAESDLERARR